MFGGLCRSAGVDGPILADMRGEGVAFQRLARQCQKEDTYLGGFELWLVAAFFVKKLIFAERSGPALPPWDSHLRIARVEGSSDLLPPPCSDLPSICLAGRPSICLPQATWVPVHPSLKHETSQPPQGRGKTVKLHSTNWLGKGAMRGCRN